MTPTTKEQFLSTWMSFQAVEAEYGPGSPANYRPISNLNNISKIKMVWAALAWLTSCLTSRTKTVCIASVISDLSICLSGVPHGFVLGPIIFSLYISPISQIVSDFCISHQQYAIDAQLYISLKSTTAGTSISHLETCLSTLHSFTMFQRPYPQSWQIRSHTLWHTSTALNYPCHTLYPHFRHHGWAFWSNQQSRCRHEFKSHFQCSHHCAVQSLSFSSQITSTYQTDDMAILIADVLVQSRLDYYNSLFFNMSCFNINKLQRIQNPTARLALNDWCSPSQEIFTKLHWLPIQLRIKFKMCTLTYKLLSANQPANLRSLITSYVPPWLLRSSDQCLLTQPRTRTCIEERAFSVCAPTEWNSLRVHFDTI